MKGEKNTGRLFVPAHRSIRSRGYLWFQLHYGSCAGDKEASEIIGEQTLGGGLLSVCGHVCGLWVRASYSSPKGAGGDGTSPVSLSNNTLGVSPARLEQVNVCRSNWPLKVKLQKRSQHRCHESREIAAANLSKDDSFSQPETKGHSYRPFFSSLSNVQQLSRKHERSRQTGPWLRMFFLISVLISKWARKY